VVHPDGFLRPDKILRVAEEFFTTSFCRRFLSKTIATKITLQISAALLVIRLPTPNTRQIEVAQPGRMVPAMRVASNELKSQKRAPVFVAILHAPALGMTLGNLDGGSFFDQILGFGHERACEHAAGDCPEEPIGVRYDYLRKRFTGVLAEIQCCPVHLSAFQIAAKEPLGPPQVSVAAGQPSDVPLRSEFGDASPTLGEGPNIEFNCLSSACFGQDAGRTSPQPR
jgi:hypothetical protein